MTITKMVTSTMKNRHDEDGNDMDKGDNCDGVAFMMLLMIVNKIMMLLLRRSL